MTVEKIANVAALIVGVTMVTALVQSPNTARIIAAAGQAFTSSLRASLGR